MSAFSDLQGKIAARLAAVDTAIPAPVPANDQPIQFITEIIGDLKNIIDRSVARIGIVGIVLSPSAKRIGAEHTSPIALKPLIEVQIQENVIVNRSAAGTQVAAFDLVVFCMRRLHLWSPIGQRISRLTLDETPYLLVSEYPILTYNVRVNASLTIT